MAASPRGCVGSHDVSRATPCVPSCPFSASAQVSEKALAQTDPKMALRTVMRSWLPLSEAVLGMAVDQLPDPISAAPERLPRLLALDALDASAYPLSPSDRQVTRKCAAVAHSNDQLSVLHRDSQSNQELSS